MTQSWDRYGDYLQLEKILTAQKPWSADAQGHNFAHDEMLFIVFHQTYELWFKQVLFEIDRVIACFAAPVVDDRDMQPMIAGLTRIAEIFKVLERQIDVLETMIPQDFIDFRDSLKSASGFQSLQFRLIETRLGLRREDRLMFNHGDYDRDYASESQNSIRKAESETTLFSALDAWLARTPFLNDGDYKFWDANRVSVHRMLDEKAQNAANILSGESLDRENEAITRGRRKFESIFADPDRVWRMTPLALQAALFVTIYRSEPMLQGPARILDLVMDIDALMARWRYRHALMVQRMMGLGAGTGGSSGYSYLMQTLEKHRIFTDLFSLSTYLIPATARPPLPAGLSRQMGYRSGTDG